MRSFLSAELLHGLHRDAGRVKKCGVVIHHLKCGVAIRHQRRGVWRGGLLRPAGVGGARTQCSNSPSNLFDTSPAAKTMAKTVNLQPSLVDNDNTATTTRQPLRTSAWFRLERVSAPRGPPLLGVFGAVG